jgi:parvulin-like peptidyl-prolyl isomerase
LDLGRSPYGLDLPKVVARVGKESISRNLVYQRMRQHEGMRPEGFKNKEVEAMKRLASRVVDQLIQQRLILHEASRLGVSVTDDEVERQYARTQENFGSQEDFEKKTKRRSYRSSDLKERPSRFYLHPKSGFFPSTTDRDHGSGDQGLF